MQVPHPACDFFVSPRYGEDFEDEDEKEGDLSNLEGRATKKDRETGSASPPDLPATNDSVVINCANDYPISRR
jgi:hypothetical protein